MSFETGERVRAMLKESVNRVVFDSKITAGSKSTLAEKQNECIMNLVGKCRVNALSNSN